MSKHRKYSVEVVSEVAASSTSIRQVLGKLGLVEAGGNYSTIKNFITKNNINVSHFTGQGSNKGRIFGPKRPLSDYLDNKFPIGTNDLKQKLFNGNIFCRKCQSCGLTDWLGKPIPLELHHIDGNSSNNNLVNLQILCPNCHTLTDNYRGKKLRRNLPRNPRKLKCSLPRKPKKLKCVKNTFCCDCSKSISPRTLRCKSCAGKLNPTKINWPTTSELLDMVNNSSFLQVGKNLGVSDNAVRKRIKHHPVN